MSVSVPPNVAKALEEVKQALREIYADRLRGLYLYGSYARGEATEDSDVDLLVVLEGEVKTGTEMRRMAHRVSEISLERDLLISILPISADWFSARRTPLLMNVRREGVSV